MSDPRYSIIPAGAVTDPQLEGRDLQVLCFLGKHTNKLGWCFLSQGTIAKQIGCGRSTVQRSIARLNAAGYVQTKVSDTSSSRPHACHAYRTIMDRDDPKIGPSELEVEDQIWDERCPPVGTPAEGVPAIDGHGGAHVYMGTERPSTDLEGGRDAGARDGFELSQQAHDLASELAIIAGHDPGFLPVRWVSIGPSVRCQMMLNLGWQPEMMLSVARAIMAAKRDGPPESVNYFEKPFARAHAQQSKPFPITVESTEKTYEKPAQRSGITAAIDRHIERFEREEREQGGCGEVRETPARLLSDRRSQR